MSRSYAMILPDTKASPVHRPSNEQETAWIQTEQARLEITLYDNGDCEVLRYELRARTPHGIGRTLLRGNVNENVFWPPTSHIAKPE